MENKFCSKCKNQIEENSNFCTKCGNDMRDTANKSNGIKFKKEDEHAWGQVEGLNKQHMMSAGQWFLGFIVMYILWKIIREIASWL